MEIVMDIKAIGFDVGHTLIKYNNPLNWGALYPLALRKVMEECEITETDYRMQSAISILNKYNTRVYPREYEVSSDNIFTEIFQAWEQEFDRIVKAKKAFYGFFQAGAICFDDTINVLTELTAKGIQLGFLTDVAYGMDNDYSLADIAAIKGYFKTGYTSVDVGFRKPNSAGYKMLLDSFDVLPFQMMYVGDEEKDIVGANNLGIISVLVNRSEHERLWGQTHTICVLSDLINLV